MTAWSTSFLPTILVASSSVSPTFGIAVPGFNAAGFKIQSKPSEYFQRQMHCTYIDDYVGVANRHFIGVDKLMWSSDYPHQASSWPHSQEVVARDFKDASAEDRLKITRANAAKLYGFAL